MSEDIPSSNNAENEMDVDVEDDEVFNDNADGTEEQNGVNIENGDEENNTKTNGKDTGLPNLSAPELPEFTRKDKTLHEILEMMEDYYPIVSLNFCQTYWTYTKDSF